MGVVLALTALLAVAAGVTDLRSRRIPNLIPGAVALLFVPALALSPELREAWLSHLLSFVLVFSGMFALFALRIMGGGDVKLLAALALFHPVGAADELVFAVALFGSAVALATALRAYLAARGTDRPLSPRQALRAKVPYGVAIAAAHLLLVVPRI